jgi:pilus assembly protein CpaE
MSRVATIVVIDQDETMRATIRDALATVPYCEVIAETDNLIYGYELIRQNRPAMVFVDLRQNARQSLEVIERISTYFKDTLIVVSGQVVSLETILQCMQAGAREYLRRPFQPIDVLNVVEKHRRAMTVDASGDTTGRIITVFSNKGGLGKTTIAVNMAIALSEAIQKPVALVDLNLHLGDVSTFMDVTPKQTITDIAKNIGRVDSAYLESSLSVFSHGQAKVYVLADPLLVEEAEDVSAEQINTVLTILRSTFQYVIVDTNTSFDTKTLTAMDLADNILLVSMVNVPTVRSTQRVLSLFERLGYGQDKVKIVINRYVPDEEITIEDVEDTLEHPVFWKIPNNYQVVMTSINRGRPIIQLDNGESMARNFLELACKVSGVIPKHLPPPPSNGKGNKKGPMGRAPQAQPAGPVQAAPPPAPVAPPNATPPMGQAKPVKESKSLLGGLFGKK